MQKDFKDLINKWGLVAFTSVWTIILTCLYFVHNKFVSKAIKTPHFISGIIFMLVLYLIVLFLHTDKKNSTRFNIILQKITGWKLLLLFFISTIMYFVLYGNDIKAFEDATNSYILDFSFQLVSKFLLLFSFLFSSLLAGNALLEKLPTITEERGAKALISLIVGIVVFVLAFFVLAFFKMYSMAAVIILVLIPILLSYKNITSNLKMLFVQATSIELNPIGIFAFFIFLFYTAANITVCFRPFPIGFDELSIYMNLPKLIADTHSLVHGGQAYNWSILMAVGYLFDGDVALATLISVFPGIIVFVLVYQIASKYTNRSYSLLAAACFYVMPTFLWQNTADAKVDIALLMFICTMVFIFVSAQASLLKAKEVSIKKFYESPWLTAALLLGILAAFSFGIKYTSMFFIMATIVALVHLYGLSFTLTASAFFASLSVMLLAKVYTFSGIQFSDPAEPKILVVLGMIASISLLGFHLFKHRLKNTSLLTYLSVFVLSLGLFFSPWLYQHYSETKKMDASSLLNGQSDQKPFILQISESNPFSSELHTSSRLLLAENNPKPSLSENQFTQKGASGTFEEVLRYLGYERGFIKYASVILDMCTFRNVNTLATDIGLFCLVLLPLIFLNSDKKYIWSNAANMFIILIVFALALYALFLPIDGAPASYMERLQQINPDMSSTMKQLYQAIEPLLVAMLAFLKPLIMIFTTQNTFQSFVIVFIIVLIMALINYNQIKSWSTLQQMLLFFIATSFVLWWMYGNAIAWYGIAIFGLAMILFISLHINIKASPILSYIFIAFCALYLFVSMLNRSAGMIATYEYDSKLNKLFLQFAGNAIDEPTAMQEVNQAIFDARTELNDNPDKKVLRIGTYANYFIDRNNQRVFEDNQLDNFLFLYNRYYGVNSVMNDALKKIGVQYILFDLNSGSIDKTPDKSLTKKIQKFYEYLSGNDRLSVVSTDRMVEDPNSKNFILFEGRKTPASYSIYGTRVLKPGSVVLLKIK